MNIRGINTRIRREVHPKIELVRGVGYFYFIGPNFLRLDTASVMVYHLDQLTPDQWVEQAKTFLEQARELRNEFQVLTDAIEDDLENLCIDLVNFNHSARLTLRVKNLVEIIKPRFESRTDAQRFAIQAIETAAVNKIASGAK